MSREDVLDDDAIVDKVLSKQANTGSDDRVLDEYFSSKQLAGISDCEKKRLRNLKLNYEMMLEVGKSEKTF